MAAKRGARGRYEQPKGLFPGEISIEGLDWRVLLSLTDEERDFVRCYTSREMSARASAKHAWPERKDMDRQQQAARRKEHVTRAIAWVLHETAEKGGHAHIWAAVREGILEERKSVAVVEDRAEWEIAVARGVSREDLIREYTKLAFRPIDDNMVSASVKRAALKDLALIQGHIVEKKEMRVVNRLEDLTTEELERIVAEGNAMLKVVEH